MNYYDYYAIYMRIGFYTENKEITIFSPFSNTKLNESKNWRTVEIKIQTKKTCWSSVQHVMSVISNEQVKAYTNLRTLFCIENKFFLLFDKIN